ncbi:hypothetical protein CAEBREN_03223 [Caenorhabditis brenneri]|uniref:Uncharacterized protein n=1 Tax=Caenorhabditis brenneri TaxID=135651 RepID=G0N883_CAEBE|nr:hypothetical protein CAEBREN_03223 [Caenorhabditis brenneri]
MPDSQIRIFPKYEYTVTCKEQDSQKISVVRHYGAILVDEVLTKLYSNLSYAPIPTGDYFLIDQHEIEKWQENETKHENDVMSFETFSDLYMETFYIRLLPIGGPGEQRILADEVLRLIPAVLKKQGKEVDQALLFKYRETWSAPDNFYRTISLDELNDVLDDFQIDKTRITAVPDIALIISRYEMPRKCTRPVQTFDIYGNEILSAAQARLFIFQTFIVKLNHVEWRNECPKDIEPEVIKLLKSYQEMKRTNLVSHKYIDAVQFEELFDGVCENCALACFEDPTYTFFDKPPEDELQIEDYQAACTRMKLPIYAHTLPDTIPVWLARIYMIGGWLQVCCLKDDEVLREMLAREAGSCMVPEKWKDSAQLKAFLNYIILNTDKAKSEFKSFIKKQKQANKKLIDKEAVNRKMAIMEQLKTIWIPIQKPEYPYLEKKMNEGSLELTCDILNDQASEEESQTREYFLNRMRQVTTNDEEFRLFFLDLEEEEQSVVLYGIVLEQQTKVGDMLEKYRKTFLNVEGPDAPPTDVTPEPLQKTLEASDQKSLSISKQLSHLDKSNDIPETFVLQSLQATDIPVTSTCPGTLRPTTRLQTTKMENPESKAANLRKKLTEGPDAKEEVKGPLEVTPPTDVTPEPLQKTLEAPEQKSLSISKQLSHLDKSNDIPETPVLQNHQATDIPVTSTCPAVPSPTTRLQTRKMENPKSKAANLWKKLTGDAAKTPQDQTTNLKVSKTPKSKNSKPANGLDLLKTLQDQTRKLEAPKSENSKAARLSLALKTPQDQTTAPKSKAPNSNTSNSKNSKAANGLGLLKTPPDQITAPKFKTPNSNTSNSKTEKPKAAPVCPLCSVSDELLSEAKEKLKATRMVLTECETKTKSSDKWASMMKEKEEEVRRLKRKNQEELKKKDREMEKVKSKLGQKVENLTKQLETAQLVKKEVDELKADVKRQKTANTKLEQSLKAELAEMRRQHQVMEALNKKYEESMVKLIREKYESQTPSTSNSS